MTCFASLCLQNGATAENNGCFYIQFVALLQIECSTKWAAMQVVLASQGVVDATPHGQGGDLL